MKVVSQLIKERKRWLGDNHIESWTDKDTEFVAKKYASQAINQCAKKVKVTKWNVNATTPSEVCLNQDLLNSILKVKLELK